MLTSVPFGLRLDGIGRSFKQEHCRLEGLCMVGAKPVASQFWFETANHLNDRCAAVSSGAPGTLGV